MSPTVFREGRYRFYFFSLEEDRMHVHVDSADGDEILRIVEERRGEIEERWRDHHRR